MDIKIERLQSNLMIIRTCAGWSTSELGERLGVSRQMISNLENGRNVMTQMQYLAIRYVLSEELRKSQLNGDTQMLKDVIRVLVDEPEMFNDEQRRQVISDANLLAPSIVAKKTTRKKASSLWTMALAGAFVATVAVGVSSLLNGKE